MEFVVAHELPGRVRFRATSPGLTGQVATDLMGVLLGSDSVEDVRVNPVTGSVLVSFNPAHRARVVSLVTSYSFDATRVHEHMASLGRGVS